MIEKLKGITNKKSFHLVMIILIIAIILFVVGIIILKYNVEGEKNMPFKLTKISIISTSNGIDKQANDSKWAFDVYQSNDIYLYIDKNDSYGKTEAIKAVNINNFQIESENKDNIKIYKPDVREEKMVFENVPDNVTSSLEYLGDVESDFKQLKISNQGGLIAFRCSNDNLVEYKSNDDEEIKHNELLKKLGITNEKLKANINFDLSILLEDGKEYKTNIKLDLPVDGVIEEGTTSKEITDLKDIIFKRVNN